MRKTERVSQFMPQATDVAVDRKHVLGPAVVEDRGADQAIHVLARQHRQSLRAGTEPSRRVARVHNIDIQDPGDRRKRTEQARIPEHQ